MKFFSLFIFISFLAGGVIGQKSTEKGKFNSTVDFPVYFDFGKSDLSPAADPTLTLALSHANQSPGEYLVEIVAHTDSIGSNAANQRLSLQRANSVKSWFVNHGTADSLIFISWQGEEYPIASNSSDAGRQQNRRATIRISRRTAMIRISGSVRDSSGKKALPATILVLGKSFRDSIVTDAFGIFSLEVPDSTVLAIDVFSSDYVYESRMFKAVSGKIPGLDFRLKSAKPGTSFVLKNFYFHGNKDVLLPKSVPELFRLLRFMEYNPELKIEIQGHINYPNRAPATRDSWHFDLSHRRAKRVYDFLFDKNIDSSRLVYNGYVRKSSSSFCANIEIAINIMMAIEIKCLIMMCFKFDLIKNVK